MRGKSSTACGSGPGRSAVGNALVFPHDTVGPRIQTITDERLGVGERSRCSQPLDPAQRIAAANASVRQLAGFHGGAGAVAAAAVAKLTTARSGGGPWIPRAAGGRHHGRAADTTAGAYPGRFRAPLPGSALGARRARMTNRGALDAGLQVRGRRTRRSQVQIASPRTPVGRPRDAGRTAPARRRPRSTPGTSTAAAVRTRRRCLPIREAAHQAAMTDARRGLPSVDCAHARPGRLAAVRETVAAARRGRSGAYQLTGPPAIADRLRSGRHGTSLRRVLNATGVVLHTNLGRAPLPPALPARSSPLRRGYCDLEFDLRRGRARRRATDHAERCSAGSPAPRRRWWSTTTPPRSCWRWPRWPAGGEVVVSRGELVEIGGSFRIPEILAPAGARLVEVGTTNRTHLDDYRRAVGARDRAAAQGAPLATSASSASPTRSRRRRSRGSRASRAARAGRRGQRRCWPPAAWPDSPASRACREPSPPAPTWSAAAATSCSAGRRRAAWWGRGRRRSRAARSTHSLGRCAPTS